MRFHTRPLRRNQQSSSRLQQYRSFRFKYVALAVWLWASIPVSAFAESPVSGLSQVLFEKLVAQLKTIYEERQPDVVLFGESHCQMQPYQFFAAETTIAMLADAHFVAAFIEEPAEFQPWYDRLIANSRIKNPMPEQQRASEIFEEGIVNADVKGAAVDCPAGVTRSRSIAENTMAKRLAAHDMTFRASDYTGDASDALQEKLDKAEESALRKQFRAVRLDERRAAKLVKAVMSVGHVIVIRGANHFLQKSETAMRETLAGLKVLTFIFDYTGHTVGDDEARIKKEGFFAFNPPDYVIDVTPQHAGIYPWPAGRRASNKN
jgi:hypothetical protein